MTVPQTTLKLNPDDRGHYEAHEAGAKFIARIINHRFRGRTGEQLHAGSRPQDTFSIGLLAPSYKVDRPEFGEDEKERLELKHPHRMGYDFYLKSEELERASVSISLHGTVYQGQIPTYDQVTSHGYVKMPAAGAPDQRIVLERVWKPYDFNTAPIEIDIPGDGQGSITMPIGVKEAADLQAEAVAEPNCLRKPARNAGDIKIGNTMPENEADYLADVAASTTDLLPIQLAFEVDLFVTPHPVDDGITLVRVIARNTSPPPLERVENLQAPWLCDVDLRTTLKGPKFTCIEEERIRETDFRYDPRQWAFGINTNAKISTDTITCDHFPVYRQPRYLPRALSNAAAIPEFERLANDPIDTLRALAKEMLAFQNEGYTKAAYDEAIANHLLPPTATFQEVEESREDFDEEIRRFTHGIDVIERHEDVRRAFVLMNKTFAASVRYRAWYTFQIVYIVNIIQDLAARQYTDATFESTNSADEPALTKDLVDVLWFPTGGGKTETYLGAIMWNAWWDRIRGKSFGVTAWAKFPLRFLSLQQQSRFLGVIMRANDLLKALQKDGKFAAAERFSLGYFVGGANTPNSWTQDDPSTGQSTNVFEILEADEDQRRDWNVIPRCPVCNQSTSLEGDETNRRFIISCPDHGELPVYTVDSEIYRHAPTVLVGTLDKMAVMAYNGRFKNLFLGAAHRCPKHGYLNTRRSGPECDIADPESCSGAIRVENLIDIAPTILLQDELHLLDAELGGFESHYESFVDYYQRELLPDVVEAYAPGSITNGPWKILGASATIKGFDAQVRHLYLKGAKRFPHPGPTRSSSFYAEVKQDKTARLYYGLRPNNMNTPTALKEAIVAVQKRLNAIASDPLLLNKELGLTLSKDECIALWDNLMLSMSYHLNKGDANNMEYWWTTRKHDFIDEIAPDDYDPQCMVLSGDTPFYKVVEIKESLENRVVDGRDHHPYVYLPATKMVSHGVDVARLVLMLFDGYPRSDSEYIQASSRPGRTWPGTIINIVQTKRPREVSHYSFHHKYHDSLDLHIDHVAVTRWGGRTYERTAPGLLASYIQMYMVPRAHMASQDLWKPQHLSNLISSGFTTHHEIVQGVARGYGADKDPEGSIYLDEVPNFVDGCLNRFLACTAATNIVEGFQEHPRPMRSMRDIEESLTLSGKEFTLNFVDARDRAKRHASKKSPANKGTAPTMDSDNESTNPDMAFGSEAAS